MNVINSTHIHLEQVSDDKVTLSKQSVELSDIKQMDSYNLHLASVNISDKKVCGKSGKFMKNCQSWGKVGKMKLVLENLEIMVTLMMQYVFIDYFLC